jgi:prepilin-type N-terminal cleavage/methylation domain-containing protein
MRLSRGAFTLIEILVVMAVISVLVGLLLPAVQKVRAAAARMQSLNNLKQQALAVHNHHDEHQRLPSYRSSSDIHPFKWSAHWQILPYLEQGNLVRVSEAHLPPAADQGIKIRILLDPTDPTDPEVKRRNGGACSYAFNMRVVGGQSVGIYWWDQRSNPKVTGLNNPPDIPGTGSLVGVGDGTSNTILLTQRFATCYDVYSHIAAFLSPDRTVYAPDWLPQVGIHPRQCVGGVAQTVLPSILVAFCDGSVRAIPGEAAKANWWAASTPNGGEVLGDW